MKSIANKKVGLDIDGVIADFMLAWHELYPEIPSNPPTYDYDKNMGARLKTMKDAGTLDDLYLNLKSFIDPDQLGFEPHCYITARPVDTEITKKWLNISGFPEKPVYTVPLGGSKVEIMKEAGVEIFIDDYFRNYTELNDNGIFCFLFDRPWNREHNVGDMRIHSLSDDKLIKKMSNYVRNFS